MKKSIVIMSTILLMASITYCQTNANDFPDIKGPYLGQKDSFMVLIPGGEFIMGKDSDKGNDFSPSHKVKLNPFYIDKHEVTNREYLRFCIETKHRLPEFWNTEIFRSGESFLDYPVIGISWYDALEFAKWAGKRLPTEAEWEFAARGSLKDKEFPNGNKWTKENPVQDKNGWKNFIEPVCSEEPNGYDLYDMASNVWEWTADGYTEDYYSISPYENPKGPQKKTNKVIRGGSWHSGTMCKKVYYRKGLTANWCDFAVGFRCVSDIKIATAIKSNE